MKEFPKSKQLFEEAKRVLPGGVNSPVRAFNSVGGSPFAAARASGAFIYDLDGNKYIDLVGSWGPMIHGHQHPDILEAVEIELKKGLSYGVTSEPEVRLAEKICEAVPSVEMLRLVNSGTEACMSAIRLARAYTKRSLILKFEGHYHGHADSFLVSAGSGLATLGVASSEGAERAQTLVVPFNDSAALKEVFSERGSEIAATILEVVTGNMGVVQPEINFIQTLTSLGQEYGSLLIADEVMTGFRLGWSGAQAMYQLDPDLSCFGKIIGGGLPVGAYGGRAEIMKMISPLGPVYQAGTLSGNPLASAAGLAALQIIEKDVKHFYQSLDSRTGEWASILRAHIEHHSYPVSLQQCGSMISIFFRPTAPRNFEEAKKADIEAFKKFFWNLIERGVYFPPSAFEACFISDAHDEEVMSQLSEKTLAALDATFG